MMISRLTRDVPFHQIDATTCAPQMKSQGKINKSFANSHLGHLGVLIVKSNNRETISLCSLWQRYDNQCGEGVRAAMELDAS